MDTLMPTPRGFVWPTMGLPGRVPLDALIGDPKQSRQYFDEEELRALAETMDPEKGGEQREILTVSELTGQERIDLLTTARYLIVSGERRWRAAKLVGLPDIEIRVKTYKNRAARKLDGFMLNENRVGLSDIEKALAVADLAEEHGWETQGEIAKALGKDQVWVSQHLALLKTSAKVREHMSPKIPEKERLKLQVGVIFSHFNHEAQDDLITRMPPSAKTMIQQIDWIKGELPKLGLELPIRNRKPSKVAELLSNLAGYVDRKASSFLELSNFDELFERTSPQQAAAFITKVKEAHGVLGKLIDRLETLASPKVIVPKASPPAAPGRPAPKTQTTPVSPNSTPRAVPAPRLVAASRQPQPPALPPVAKAPQDRPEEEYNVKFLDSSIGRIVMRPMKSAEYRELRKNKRLSWQIEHNPEPDYIARWAKAGEGK